MRFNPHAREGRDVIGMTVKNNNNVSIHTPVKGATAIWCQRRGRLQVSIHTPVKGATCRKALARTSLKSFNPHAREGRDQRYDGHTPL